MERSRDFFTGLVFFGLLVVLMVATVILAGIRLGPVPKMTIVFTEGINGLEEGHDVRVDGYRNGKVRVIDLKPETGEIHVTAVFDKKPALYEGATFTVAAASPLGGRVLEIRNKPFAERGEALDLSFRPPGTSEADALTEAGNILRENRENVKKAVASWGSSVDFIHVESADLDDPSQPSAAAQAWGLPPDVPWTFVMNKLGTIESRVEGPLGSAELELLIQRAVGQ